MLHLVDEALEALMRTRVGTDIDISFRAPDSEWSAGVGRPTVNLYLWNLRASDEAGAGIETYRNDAGHVVRRPVRPRMLLRYLVTAWAVDPRDEHNLLGSVATVFAVPQELGVDLLPAALREIRPFPVVSLSAHDPGDRADFWTSLGGRFHAGLDVQVLATVDPQITWRAGPPTTSIETKTIDRLEPARSSARDKVLATRPDADDPGDPSDGSAGAR